MASINSGAASFGFGSGTAATKENNNIEKNPQVDNKPEASQIEKELNSPYVDKKTVSVALVKNFSLYRKVNSKSIPRRVDYIGSSVTSSRILAANKDEVEAYFPNLIGLAPNNAEFVTRVKQYLNNIRIPINELGKTFDISFSYRHKSDYIRVKAEEDKIDDDYNKANRKDIKHIKEALATKISALNALESTKCQYGSPVNTEDYIMYRHCLLYKDIAKDIALINSDPTIRFYFKDDQKEVERLKKYRLEVNKAKSNYVACLADEELFDAIFTQYCVVVGRPILSAFAETRLDREIKLDKFSTDEPIKFNKIYTNGNVKTMSMIEHLIARGELNRSQYNQNITAADGTFIGANMSEAVAWFKDSANNSVVNAYKSKLRNI